MYIIIKKTTIISDSLCHDTVAVYEFQRVIIQSIKTKKLPSQIYYFTDGATQHFKYKYNFINALYHKEDFGVICEWHFLATAYGKGPCDSIGVILKRLAVRTSLQVSAKDAIITAENLYKWAYKSLRETSVFFVSEKYHLKTKEFLEGRFARAQTIVGTQKYHCYIPVQDCTLICKQYPSCPVYKTVFCNKSSK